VDLDLGPKTENDLCGMLRKHKKIGEKFRVREVEVSNARTGPISLNSRRFFFQIFPYGLSLFKIP
jgi:hypothetical protein